MTQKNIRTAEAVFPPLRESLVAERCCQVDWSARKRNLVRALYTLPESSNGGRVEDATDCPKPVADTESHGCPWAAVMIGGHDCDQFEPRPRSSWSSRCSPASRLRFNELRQRWSGSGVWGWACGRLVPRWALTRRRCGRLSLAQGSDGPCRMAVMAFASRESWGPPPAKSHAGRRSQDCRHRC
jgi:hypothetical protein